MCVREYNMRVRMCMCIYLNAYVHTCTHTRKNSIGSTLYPSQGHGAACSRSLASTHTHTHTHTHIHTHTHTHTQPWSGHRGSACIDGSVTFFLRGTPWHLKPDDTRVRVREGERASERAREREQERRGTDIQQEWGGESETDTERARKGQSA